MELKKSYWSFDLCLFLSSTQDWTFILEYYVNENIQQDEKVGGDGVEGRGIYFRCGCELRSKLRLALRFGKSIFLSLRLYLR